MNRKSDVSKEMDNSLVFSYLTFRKLIGISGMLLPLVLIISTTRTENDKFIEHSISEYYYTSNGDVFVVLMSVLGVFLFTYNGYSWKERLLSSFAAIGALGVAFSPTATFVGNSASIHKTHTHVPMIFGLFERHFLFAGTFLISAALLSIIFFPKLRTTDFGVIEKTRQKKARNMIYRICGWTILGSIACIVLYFIIKPELLKDMPVVFFFETIAVEAFGISWLTKGHTLIPNGEHDLKKAYKRAKGMIIRPNTVTNKSKEVAID